MEGTNYTVIANKRRESTAAAGRGTICYMLFKRRTNDSQGNLSINANLISIVNKRQISERMTTTQWIYRQTVTQIKYYPMRRAAQLIITDGGLVQRRLQVRTLIGDAVKLALLLQ